jgi:tetratricopeptide (TPR) repeat protein
MAKKIKVRTEKPEEEKLNDVQQAEQKAEDAAQAAAGIQDEFQARGFEFVEWVHEHPSAVLGGLGLVVLVGLGVGISSMVTKHSNGKASAAYSAALEAYDAPIDDAAGTPPAHGPHYKDANERAKASREMFRTVVSEHSGSGAAILAQLYIGNDSLKLGELDEAKKAYDTYLSQAPAGDALRFAGLEGLATALEAKGDRKGAIEKLEQLSNLPEKIEADAALLDLARLYKADGNVDAAKKALGRITAEFASSPLKSRADELATTLTVADARPAK